MKYFTSLLETMDKDFQLWRTNARKAQDMNSARFSNIGYDQLDKKSLKRNIGFSLFGWPEDGGYDEKQTEYIDSFVKTVISISEDKQQILLAKIYILYKELSGDKKEQVVPIFRIGERSNTNHKFIDSSGRVYSSWKHYLEKNNLPKCDICYPIDGVYSFRNNVAEIRFEKSNACDVSNTMLSNLDTVSNITNVVSVGVLIAAQFTPICWPAVISAYATSATCGTYDISRSVAKLVDMNEHNQSIGLDSVEARKAWMNIFLSSTSVLAMGGNALAKKILQETATGSTTLFRVMKFVDISTLCTSGFTAAVGLAAVILKCISGSIDRSDVNYFVMTVLYLFNKEIALPIAKLLIEKISSMCVMSYDFISTAVRYVPVRATECISDVGESFHRLVALITGGAAYLVSINIHQIECAVISVTENVTSVLRYGGGKVVEFFSYIVQAIKNIFSNVKNLLTEFFAINKMLLMDLINKTHSDNSFAKPLNIEALKKINLILSQTVEKMLLGQECYIEDNIRKQTFILYTANTIPVVRESKTLTEYSEKLDAFCNYLIERFQKSKDEAVEKYDEENLKEGTISNLPENLNDSIFNACLTLSSWQIDEINKKCALIRCSHTDVFYKDFDYGNLFSFALDKKEFSQDEYFTIASEFSGFDINENTSEAFKHDGVIMITSKVGVARNIPRIYLYFPDVYEELDFGIGLIEKNIYLDNVSWRDGSIAPITEFNQDAREGLAQFILRRDEAINETMVEDSLELAQTSCDFPQSNSIQPTIDVDIHIYFCFWLYYVLKYFIDFICSFLSKE